MRGMLVFIFALVVLSLCAHTCPLPAHFHYRQTIPAADRSSEPVLAPASKSRLGKRSPASPATTAVRGAEQALAAKRDWKRPVVISISAIGLVMTVGWNYISLQSFLANRERYKREQRRRQAEKSKPPPAVGDTVCTIETYSTVDQVQTRTPSTVKTPCFKLGPQVKGREVSPGVGPTVSTGGDAGQEGANGQPQQTATYNRAYTDNSAAAAPPYVRGSAGGWTKRGLPTEKAALEMAEQAPAFRSALSPTSAVLSSLDPKHNPLSQLNDGESARLLPSFSRSAAPPPGPARLRPGYATPHRDAPAPAPPPDPEHEISQTRITPPEGVTEEAGKRRRKWKVWRTKAGSKLSTEDITFGLTVLNTIGNIPSLILTTINAYCYRGNPKVD